jgi:hypothetical protein
MAIVAIFSSIGVVAVLRLPYEPDWQTCSLHLARPSVLPATKLQLFVETYDY